MNPILIHQPRCGSIKTPRLRASLLATGACLLIAAGVLSSCHTVQGFGRDVEQTGDAIEDAAS
jgi:predicted small secreted protein